MTNIVCSGDHPTPVVLGTYTPSKNGPSDHAGMLCDDCGPAYCDDVAMSRRPAGTIPRRADVDAYMSRTTDAQGRPRRRSNP